MKITIECECGKKRKLFLAGKERPVIVVGETPTVAKEQPSKLGTVDCAGTPPTYFDGWAYRPSDQLPNLYKGVVDMSEVTAVQAPSQANGYARLDVIERELKDVEFVGAHVAEWYQRPENLAAFLAVCPSGYLVFLEKYRRIADRNLRVVFLYVRDGQVRVDGDLAPADFEFDAWYRFAVRRKLNV